MKRIEPLPTLKINPSNKLYFNYRGKIYYGYEGDTVATALFASGIRIFSRSIKYHRPRGLYCLDAECSNSMMKINGVPNLNAEKTLLEEGMSVEDQNVKGSAKSDLYGFLDKLDGLMPAGFYYQIMHKPKFIWPIAMKNIRKMAGIGSIDPEFTLEGECDQIFPTTDVCVIGGGPAGMNAAIVAADKGLRVILLEARPYLGGFFQYRTAAYSNGKTLYDRSNDLALEVKKHENIRVFVHTAMMGSYNNNLITAFQTGSKKDAFDYRYIEMRATSVVVATGCIERPLMFEHNEKPGIMQIACAHRLVNSYGILPGKQIVFSIGHDLGFEAAIDLHDKGAKIQGIFDSRPEGQNQNLLAKLLERKIPFQAGWVASEALGRKVLKGIKLVTLDGSQSKTIECDTLVASAGLTPLAGPITVSLGKLKYDKYTNFFLPKTLPGKMHVGGRILGYTDSFSIEVSGSLAGLNAAADCSEAVEADIAETLKRLAALPGPEKGNNLVMAPVSGRKSFVCFDEDVTVKHIKQAIGMGFDVPELIKRFTSCGLGPGQGGVPGHNLPMFVSHYTSDSLNNVQPTNVRSPIVPAYIGIFAGTNHDMAKRTPMHAMQVKAGGIFRRIGAWKRARYFSKDLSCKEEILNVRNNVGLLDSSTLGKFRIHGADALKAMQRVFINNVATIKEGRVRYSAMCNEDGCVIDDGVIVKDGENDYYFTTSSGRAGHTIEWIRFHTRYENWNFNIVNLTDALGVINISGPNSRKVLEEILENDISNEGLPFSGYRNFKVKDVIPVKVMRLGFVGELSYEIHIASSYMAALWKLIEEVGQKFGIKNFGVEAQNVMRMEKGHIILGQESEQRTNLLDLGMGFLFARKKVEEKKVGAVALKQTENKPDRLKLVGIKMKNSGRAAKDGSVIVDKKIRGYVCTMRKSFTLNEAVGMALVDEPLAKEGSSIEIYEDGCNGKTLSATVTSMPFYDPDGGRMKM